MGGETCILIIGRDGESQKALYRGSLNDGLSNLWPHEFITRDHELHKPDVVLSYRTGRDGFRVNGKTAVPIPGEDGRAFYSNRYDPAWGESPSEKET